MGELRHKLGEVGGIVDSFVVVVEAPTSSRDFSRLFGATKHLFSHQQLSTFNQQHPSLQSQPRFREKTAREFKSYYLTFSV
jgi:hypothetical protein